MTTLRIQAEASTSLDNGRIDRNMSGYCTGFSMLTGIGSQLENVMAWNRREFLRFLGLGSLGVSIESVLSSCDSEHVSTLQSVNWTQKLAGISPSAEDQLLLHPDLQYQVLLREGDKLNSRGDLFGAWNDFIALTSFDDAQTDVMLSVNHESFLPLVVSGRQPSVMPTLDEALQEMRMVGMSFTRIRREPHATEWQVVHDDRYNRRIDARTRIPFVAERAIAGAMSAVGTMANCAGGVTPWKTVLSCEENHQDFWGSIEHDRNGTESRIEPLTSIGWIKHGKRPSEHYGWVLEVDPFTGNAKKLVSMGRFSHECATVILGREQRPVVYLADDKADEHIYKFIANRPGSLEQGELFVADTVNGRWLSLDIKKQPALAERFQDQTDVLIHARYAAKILGATPQDRPEDVEIDPRTGAVYVTLTNNAERNNYFGGLLKIEETNADPLSLTFTASTLLTGSVEAGFACPDNLAFDPRGNLWMCSDINGVLMHKPPYESFKNNGLFFIPLSGAQAGRPIQVASAPHDAEFTGPVFSADGRTLFLSVQHPGEDSTDRDAFTSHWPDGGDSKPLSCVVTLSGPLLDRTASIV